MDALWLWLIESEDIFNGPMPVGMDRKHNHHNQKEGKMINRRIGLLVLMVVVVFLAGVISLYAGETDKININTASAEELTRLKGIGPSHAAKIVAYREENGPFKTPEDVIKVPGIGQKTFDSNAEFILVEKPDENWLIIQAYELLSWP